MYRSIIAACILLRPITADAREAGRGAPVDVTAHAVVFDDKVLADTRLDFLGAISITSADPTFSGFTGLRWSQEERRLFAVTKHGGWFELPTIESEKRLTSIGAVRGGSLLNLRGQPATGPAADAQALDAVEADGWTVLIGAQRLLLRYRHLDAKPTLAQLQVREPRGNRFASGKPPEIAAFETSDGVSFKALGLMRPEEYPTAFHGNGPYFICARRAPLHGSNCASVGLDNTETNRVGASAPVEGAVPSDMDGIILMQATGQNGILAVLVEPGFTNKTLAVFGAPGGAALEGIAMRSEGPRSYLYLVSDSSRAPDSATLIMKFELLSRPKRRP